MGCFKFCFGTFNSQKVTPKRILIHKNQQKSVNFEPLHPTKPIQVLNSARFESKCRDENDFQLNSNSVVNVHKEDLIQKVVEFLVNNKEKECDIGNGENKMLEKEKETADLLVPEDSSESLFSLLSESRKQLGNAEENGNLLVQEESSDSLFSVSVGSQNQVNAVEDGHLLLREESSDSLFSISVGSRNQENEDENSDSLVQQESSTSLFSVSVESRKIKIDENEIEVNSPITFGLRLNHISKYHNPSAANSILEPVENLTQWKKATSDTCTAFDDQKENVIPFSEEEPSLKKFNPISKQRKGSHLKVERSQLTVDTSLSSWLVKSGESSYYSEVLSASSKKLEDRLVLTAMTIEDLKQHSVTSSLRRSPSRYSPDMIPIVATVGSYLSHTGQGSASSDSGSYHSRMSTKFRKDDTCHSTPLLQMLENA